MVSRNLLRILKKYNYSSPGVHAKIWESFYHAVNDIDYLKKHRDYIEKFNYGYGDRPFHFMWKLLVEEMPKNFSFLEIGVFKGQVTSLIQLLADRLEKRVKIYGVTPLNGVGDKYGSHPIIDYMEAIKKIYNDFNLDFSNTSIIKGFSQDPSIIKKVAYKKPYDIVFIDGCHDYKVVVNDIENYSKFVRRGGLLVIDDSACFVNLPKFVNKGKNIFSKIIPSNRVSLFKGLMDVSLAVKDILGNNKDFLHIFSCGHDRVWIRT